MSANFFALTCLGLLYGQTTPEVFHTNQRGLKFPINFVDARKADIRELILYTSTDKGQTWYQALKVKPDQSHFVYTAPADGEYWMQVAAINAQGQQEPTQISKDNDHQRMVIDTLRPFIRLVTAQRQGDEVFVQWEVKEDHADWKTMQLEYQASPSLVWSKVNIIPGATGQTRFSPNTQGAVQVRLSLADQAGNTSSVSDSVVGPGGASPLQLTQAQSKANDPLPGIPPLSTDPSPPPSFPSAPTFVPVPAPIPTPMKEPETPKTVVPPPVFHSAPIPPLPMPTPPTTAPTTIVEEPKPPIATSIAPPKVPISPNTGSPRVAPKDKSLIADSTIPAPIVNPVAPAAPVAEPHRAEKRPVPGLQYVNHPEVTLEYEINRVGPSGIKLVHFYLTRDDGQTWKPYGYDDYDLKPGRHHRLIKLDGDGVYGFLVVVKNKADLGREAPKQGDLPDIRFEVDTLPPVAQLFKPEVDPTRDNTLILGWNANDSNLAPNPITLEWSEKQTGPWRPIIVNAPNTKRHAWQLPEGLPFEVYLRLKVRDLAGNEGVAITPRPETVDLTVPESRVIGVGVAPR